MMTANEINVLRRTLADAEGFRRSAYQDSQGYATIGFGRLIDARRGGGISREEGLLLLENDLSTAVRECERAFPWFAEQNSVRQRVFAELCFNMGLPTLLTFVKTLGSVAAGDYDTAATQLLQSKWARQVGGRRSMRLARMLRTGVDA